MPASFRDEQLTIPPLGHDSIDHDHDELLDMCHALVAAEAQDIARSFVALRAKFTDHFALEDSLMSSQEFSSRQCHLDEHAAVLQSFEEVSQLLATGDTQIARRLAESLVDWLPDHVDALDRHLTKLLFYRQTGGASIQLRF